MGRAWLIISNNYNRNATKGIISTLNCVLADRPLLLAQLPHCCMHAQPSISENVVTVDDVLYSCTHVLYPPISRSLSLALLTTHPTGMYLKEVHTNPPNML